MDAAACKERGNTAYRDGKYDIAIDWYSRALALNPQDHLLWSNRSQARLSADAVTQALHDADECIALDPTWVKGYARRAMALVRMDRSQDAVKSLQQGLRHDANSRVLRGLLRDVKNGDVKLARPGTSSSTVQGAGAAGKGAGDSQTRVPRPLLGRDTELEQVRALLEKNGRTSITGAPGVGKSTFAEEYCYRYASKYTVVVALDMDRLSQDLPGMCRRLGMPGFALESTMTQWTHLVRALDAMRSKWLLVLDNVAKVAAFPWSLPLAHRLGDVVIVSRHDSWATLMPGVVLSHVSSSSKSEES